MVETAALESLGDSTFEDCRRLIHELTGITIGNNRKAMIHGRLRRRAAELQLGSYEQYLSLVKSEPAERGVFIDLVTTNETYCYRTPRIWEYLISVFVPAWFERHRGETFRAWSAAASSGEEAHTLGVLLEHFREGHPGFVYQILGTDISKEMIGLCEEGLYGGKSIEAFKRAKPHLVETYMESEDGVGYRVKPAIKSRMKFQVHNLFKRAASREAFDLVLLRNVLIYFTAEDQEKVLREIDPLVKEDGVLIIGESESLFHIRTNFKAEMPLVYRKASFEEAGKGAA